MKVERQIFISYSTETDKNKMESVKRFLTKSRFFKPIVIADNRRSLSLFSQKVKDGIDKCDYILPILTKESMASQWVNQEIGYAIAKQKSIYPIVDTCILKDLKGFIHSQLEVYAYTGSLSNPQLERTNFRKTVKLLISDLVDIDEELDQVLTFEDVFPGVWESLFMLKNKSLKRVIQVKNQNQWYEDGKLKFRLKNLKLDKEKNKISFSKVNVGDSNYIIDNELNIINLGRVYEGLEQNSRLGRDIPIRYLKQF